MSLSFAIDELRATGWSGLDSSGCGYHNDGRAYPNVARVQREFDESGCELLIEWIDRYKCWRAEWVLGDGTKRAVVGESQDEAAVFALAQFRRELVTATV